MKRMNLLEYLSAREFNVARLNLIVALAFATFVALHPAVPAWQFIRLIAEYAPLTLLMGALALLCFAFRRGWPNRMFDVVIDRWRADRFVTLGWPLLLFAIVMPSFSAFKQRIIPLAGFHFDHSLAAIDRAMFGVDPGLWLHNAIGTPLLTSFLDAVYHAWFIPMSIGVGIVALYTDPRTRMQYMTAYAMTWIGLGSVLAYLLPAAGPCYFHLLAGAEGSAPFDAVNTALYADRAAGSTNFLFTLNVKDMLLNRFNDPNLSIGGGISAIPSIHNAMAVLFALAGFRFNRTLGLLMSGFAALIWIGSIYLNWHYAIDGIVGAAGSVGLWYLAGLLTGSPQTTEDHASEPALIPTPDPL